MGNPFIGCEDWKERYRRLAEKAGDLLVERLLALRAPGPFCLLCAEKDPADCHRQFLAAVLAGLGHEVEHLR